MLYFDMWSLFKWYLRPFIKWFLRKTTRLCELQRICYGDKVGAERTCNVEQSLILSRNNEIKEAIRQLDFFALDKYFTSENLRETINPVVRTVVRVKDINLKLHNRFPVMLRECLEQIWSYRQLLHEVEDLRKIQYDSDLIEHEEKLLKLWNLLVPDEPLEARITKQWQNIGFQGDDPKTDFRGMGLLGLENLIFFAVEYPQASSHVLSHSLHPLYGYTYAIVGINLTSMAYTLLKDGSAKTYMFNSRQGLPNLNLFHKFYCYLFYEFDKLWIASKPTNIMEFSAIFKQFDDLIRNELSDPASVFRINLEIDTV